MKWMQCCCPWICGENGCLCTWKREQNDKWHALVRRNVNRMTMDKSPYLKCEQWQVLVCGNRKAVNMQSPWTWIFEENAASLYMDIWRQCSRCTWTYEANAVSVHRHMKRMHSLYMHIWRECSLCSCTNEENAVSVHAQMWKMKSLYINGTEKCEQNDMSLCMDFVKKICFFYMKVRKCGVLVRGFMKRMPMQSLVMAINHSVEGSYRRCRKKGKSLWVVLIHWMLAFAWSLVFILHYICWCFNLFINFTLGVHFVRQIFTCIADIVKKKRSLSAETMKHLDLIFLMSHRIWK